MRILRRSRAALVPAAVTFMPRARSLAVVVLLLSYGAVGARQPAVRSAAPLPAPAESLARSLKLSSTDRSRIVLDIVRLIFDTPINRDPEDLRLQATLQTLAATANPGETVPLPLDRSIWRDTLLRRDVPDAKLIGAILSEPTTALVYHGLSALDDETLAWLGPDRDLLAFLLKHPGAFSAFGRSLRVKAGRIVVPGGPDAEPLWEAIVGAPAQKPAAFARRLFSQWEGRLAFFYDSIAHLDPPSLKFALGDTLPASARIDRLRALANVFEQTTGDTHPELRPFARQLFDPALTLPLLKVTDEGRFVGPDDRAFWEATFRYEGEIEPSFAPFAVGDMPRSTERTSLDAAWIVSRIHRGGFGAGRRRLESVLFAQRNFDASDGDIPEKITVLRALSAFPALITTLERSGITSPAVLAGAAARAEALSRIEDDHVRRAATMQFQGALTILTSARRSDSLTAAKTITLLNSLVALDSAKGYDTRLAQWLQDVLIPALPPVNRDQPRPLERTVLAAVSGARDEDDASGRTIEWEGRTFRVDPAQGALRRLQRIRERQGGTSLDDALAAALSGTPAKAPKNAPQALPDVLASIAYSLALGDPDGDAMAGGDVALRHDLADGPPKRRKYASWQLPTEEFGAPGGWRLNGSLLGLEVPLARLALRRLDNGTMPPGPRLTSSERHAAALTVVLMSPRAVNDAGRDEIVAAIARGRARVAALTGDRAEIERIATEAGLNEWRRESLAWSLQHQREIVPSHFSLLELLWLGAPRNTEAIALDAWGATTLRATGCLCLELPRPATGDYLSGRPVSGMLGLRGSEVALRVAEALAEVKVPATLAPAVLAFAMQEVLDAARLAYHDDWTEFSRAAAALDKDQIADYISALAAGGPLLPPRVNGDKRP
jgi:hypothetical protein